MTISRLHYISMQTHGLSHLQAIEAVCRAGGDWVQLRLKDMAEAEILEIAGEARVITRVYGAHLIINDFVHVAKAIGADGVHLGKSDMNPRDARAILDEKMIIGGTANTFEDVLRCVQDGVDYLGVGPFRFTQTKEKLSPVLGKEGLERLVENCFRAGINVPLIAIGGIREEDVPDIMETGVYGIAVSGSITHSISIAGTVQNFNKQLSYGKAGNSR